MVLGITGGSGFVGRTLVDIIRAKKIQYISFLRTTDSDSNSFTIGDISDLTDWKDALSDVSVLIHLASIAHGKTSSVDDYESINYLGTLNLAKQAATSGVKRFVFISSVGVLGSSTGKEGFTGNSIPAPENLYSLSKAKTEDALKELSRTTGMEIVIIRPPLIYGRNAPGNFGMLTKLIKRLPVLPFGLATNRRNFISVQNLADLLITCATHPNAAGHTFLASDSETVSIKEFTNAIAKGLGKKVIQLPVPVTLMRLAGKLAGKSTMIEQLYGNLEVDSSNIKEVLGWTPPFTMEQSMAFLKHTDK
ncbi:NAD-dependent epimerase/dehydratase family protein [Vibrio vulnificus]